LTPVTTSLLFVAAQAPAELGESTIEASEVAAQHVFMKSQCSRLAREEAMNIGPRTWARHLAGRFCDFVCQK